MQVVIKNGMFHGKLIEGTYETTGRTWFPLTLPSDAPEGFDGKVGVMLNGSLKMVWVAKTDYELIGEDAPVNKAAIQETDEELKARINKRFEVMDKMASGVIKGTIRSLIISGAPGIGKTYTLDKCLQEAHDTGVIEYNTIKGKCSPIGLYMSLYENREPGSVLVLDDVDVFSNEDFLNLLKAALDTGDKRIVSWSTASSWLEEKEIPNEFEFQGSIVFITNCDIDSEIARGSKLAPHLDALQSRSIYLDLCVHTNREIMIRVEDVVMSTDMLQRRGLSNIEAMNALYWMKENVNKLRNVSLRTALYLADFVKTDNNWVDLAEVTLLK